MYYDKRFQFYSDIYEEPKRFVRSRMPRRALLFSKMIMMSAPGGWGRDTGWETISVTPGRNATGANPGSGSGTGDGRSDFCTGELTSFLNKLM